MKLLKNRKHLSDLIKLISKWEMKKENKKRKRLNKLQVEQKKKMT